MVWVKTVLKDIDEAQELAQDIGLWPEPFKAKGFLAFKVWTEHGWVTFAQPKDKRVVAYTPRNYDVSEGLKVWTSPYKTEARSVTSEDVCIGLQDTGGTPAA